MGHPLFPISLISQLPLWHRPTYPPAGPYFTHWYIQPGVAIATVVLAAAYILVTGPLNRRRPGAEDRPVTGRQQAFFLAGCVFLFLALGPPMEDWAGWFLLSAHMVQHLILFLLVPPLFLLGTPGWLIQPLTRYRPVDRVGRALTRPVPALVLASMVMAVWHFPVFYERALGNDFLHAFEHGLFLGTGILLWWSMCGPIAEWPKLNPPLQCLFLFLAMIPMGVVGAIITMSDTIIYESYAQVSQRPFNLDLLHDQQIAGLLMWVGSNTITLALITFIFLRWANREVRADHERDANATRAGRAARGQATAAGSAAQSASTPGQ